MESTPENVHTSSDVSVEEDIVDQLCTVDLNGEIPTRPSSRLGFNRDEDNDPPLTTGEPFERVYHESLYEAEATNHTIRLDEHESDITTLIPERDEISTRRRPSHLVEDWKMNYDVQSMSENEELDCSSGEDFDEDCTTSLSHVIPSPLDEFVRSFSQPIEESDWSISSKFSCLPSPLSSRYIPFNASSYHHIPQRHRYRHHGHSRHALLHLKWFWASREDTWLEHNARMFKAKAYDGLSIFSSVSPRLRLPGGCVPQDPADTPQPPPSPMTCLPPLSVHPRRGDLSALHDPYCMHIDRYFVGMPLWTMSKTLWMFDVHMASGELQTGQHDVDNDLFEHRSGGESIETSESNAFSDDSDSTLVESDHEGDHLRDPRHDNQGDIRLESKGYQTPEHDADASSPNIPIMGDLSRSSISPKSTSTNSEFFGSPPWPSNWYRRWEILLQLCVQNNSKTSQPNILSISKSKPQRFFIGDDWDDDLSEEDEEEEAQEDHEPKNNVLIVVNDECSSGRHLRRWF